MTVRLCLTDRDRMTVRNRMPGIKTGRCRLTDRVRMTGRCSSTGRVIMTDVGCQI
jgi:hypothetical protein